MSGLTFEIGAREARVLAGPYVIAEIAVGGDGRWREVRRFYPPRGIERSGDDARPLLTYLARDYVGRYASLLAGYEREAAEARARAQRLDDRAWMLSRPLNALRAALEEESDG